MEDLNSLLDNVDALIIMVVVAALIFVVPFVLWWVNFFKVIKNISVLKKLSRRITRDGLSMDLRDKKVKGSQKYKDQQQFAKVRDTLFAHTLLRFFKVWPAIPLFFIFNFMVGGYAFLQSPQAKAIVPLVFNPSFHAILQTAVEWVLSNKFLFAQYVLVFLISSYLASIMVRCGFAEKSRKAMNISIRLRMPSMIMGVSFGFASLYLLKYSVDFFGWKSIPVMFFAAASVSVLTPGLWFAISFLKGLYLFYNDMGKEKVANAAFIKQVLEAGEVIIAHKIYGPTMEQKFQDSLDEQKKSHD